MRAEQRNMASLSGNFPHYLGTSNGLMESELFRNILSQAENPLGILLESMTVSDLSIQPVPHPEVD